MQEQHVSTAAKRLNLSQSAISNSLQQLRELFKDELLIRSPKKMIPTKKALVLANRVERIMLELESLIFYTDEFIYKTSTRTFHLAMTDYTESVLLPKLYTQINKLAPNISLKIHHYNELFPQNFEDEGLDLGIGLEAQLPKQLVSQRLFSDYPVCVAHKKHAIFKQPLTLDSYLQQEHIITCVHSEELSRVDRALKKFNLTRNIKLTLPNVLPALQAISDSSLVGTFSKQLAVESQEKYHLKYIDLPFDVPKFHIVQTWHRQQDSDSGLAWMRALIKKVCDQYFL